MAVAPLSGLRVLEIGTGRAGAFATCILGDLGADVVKIENELSRPAGAQARIDRAALDRNKQSVLLDYSTAAGLQVLLELIGHSDVLIDEFDQASLRDLRLDDAALADANARLVHCSVAAFGATPSAGAPLVSPESADLIVQAFSGNMDLTGEAGGAPFELGLPLSDLMAGVYAVIGVLGSVARPGSTVARRVEIAEIDVAVALLSYMAVGFFADGVSPTRVGTGHSTIFPYNSFRASDGEVVVAPFTQRFWRNFCAATDRADLLDVDTYRNFARRLEHKSELLAIFEPIMRGRTVDEWVQTFRLHDVPSGPVLSVQGALELEQSTARGMTPELELADGTSIRSAGSPFRMHYADGTSFTPSFRRAPEPGEHTAAVFDAPATVRVP